MPTTTRVVGHRGNPARFPDNSIEGILDARRIADMAEIDVRRTSDGELVLSHDAHVGGRALIDFPASTFPELARFEEVLAVVGDFPLNIEIKNWPDDPDFDSSLETPRRIATYARDIDLITSFHWPTVAAARHVRTDVATGLLVDRAGDIPAALDQARAGHHQAIAPHWSLVTDPAQIMDAAGGLAVNVWTVNDDALAHKLIEAGISAIITDDPARMRRLIEETQ